MDFLGSVWAGKEGGKPIKIMALTISIISIIMIGVTAGLYIDYDNYPCTCAYGDYTNLNSGHEGYYYKCDALSEADIKTSKKWQDI